MIDFKNISLKTPNAMRIIQCSVIIFCFVLIASCKKDKVDPDIDKTVKPTITVVSKNYPTVSEILCNANFDNVLKVSTGNDLKIQFKFKGANKLSQYKIDIHNNFDCHTHGRMAASNPWQVLKSVDLNDNEVEVNETLTVPAHASVGNYHFIVQLIDELGNEAVPTEFNVILLNETDPTPPVINLTTPNVDSIAVARGNNLSFIGPITDNSSLNGGKVQISYIDSAGTQFDIQELVFSPTQGNSYNLNYTYTIPTFSVKGKSVFYVRAFDEVNNVGVKQVIVTIF